MSIVDREKVGLMGEEDGIASTAAEEEVAVTLSVQYVTDEGERCRVITRALAVDRWKGSRRGARVRRDRDNG